MIHAPQTPCFAGIMTALPRKPMTRASRPPEDDGGTATVAEEAAPTITLLGGSPLPLLRILRSSPSLSPGGAICV